MINKNKNKKGNLSKNKDDIKNTENNSLLGSQNEEFYRPILSKTGKAGKNY